MKTFSKHWKSSKKPKKQRKYLARAPLHIRRKFVSAHLSKELRKKHKRRNVPVRKGDTVKVLRGQNKGKSGKINKVDLRRIRVYIDGIDFTKKDGSKIFYPVHPSNLLIQELNASDKERVKMLGRNTKK